MISSTVYEAEGLLQQVYVLLKTYGYEVWSSPSGTIPVDPGKSNFENCLEAVHRCDAFLGFIRPVYGSGKQGRDLSITHQELKRAVELDKPRWMLVHSKVTFARRLLKQYRHDMAGNPINLKFISLKGEFDDLRVIDMYGLAIQADKPLSERKNNWVQEYHYDQDALDFVKNQFEDIERIKTILEERNKS